MAASGLHFLFGFSLWCFLVFSAENSSRGLRREREASEEDESVSKRLKSEDSEDLVLLPDILYKMILPFILHSPSLEDKYPEYYLQPFRLVCKRWCLEIDKHDVSKIPLMAVLRLQQKDWTASINEVELMQTCKNDIDDLSLAMILSKTSDIPVLESIIKSLKGRTLPLSRTSVITGLTHLFPKIFDSYLSALGDADQSALVINPDTRELFEFLEYFGRECALDEGVMGRMTGNDVIMAMVLDDMAGAFALSTFNFAFMKAVYMDWKGSRLDEYEEILKLLASFTLPLTRRNALYDLVLVPCLTSAMAEDGAGFLRDLGLDYGMMREQMQEEQFSGYERCIQVLFDLEKVDRGEKPSNLLRSQFIHILPKMERAFEALEIPPYLEWLSLAQVQAILDHQELDD